MAKRVLVLKCSPRMNGNSDMLADAFIKGAKESGHVVVDLHIGRMRISPCVACGGCYSKGSPCVINDDMQRVYPELFNADVVVIASPVYYFSFTAQYKAMLDRFFALEAVEDKKPKGIEVALLMTAGDTDEKVFNISVKEYKTVFENWFGWRHVGKVLATEVYNKGDIKGNPKLDEAYRLGKGL